MDSSALFTQRVAASEAAAKMRSDAAKLRDDIRRSAGQLAAMMDDAMRRTEIIDRQIQHIQVCGLATTRPSCPRHSLIERLQARLASQPVIEQAKGMLMARQGCDPDEAFDILRRASQRTNTPVRELAKHLVASTARPARSGAGSGRLAAPAAAPAPAQSDLSSVPSGPPA